MLPSRQPRRSCRLGCECFSVADESGALSDLAVCTVLCRIRASTLRLTPSHWAIVAASAVPVCGGLRRRQAAIASARLASHRSAPERLSWIHQLMHRARSAGLEFRAGRRSVPSKVSPGLCTRIGCGTSPPGCRAGPISMTGPRVGRLEAACTALGPTAPRLARCFPAGRLLPRHWPSAGNRGRVDDRLLQSDWRPAWGADADDPVRPWAERAVVLAAHLGFLSAATPSALDRPPLALAALPL